MTDHPFFQRKSISGISKDHERSVAKSFGRRMPASGASQQAHKKGDVQSDKLMIEAKATRKGSFNLKHDTLAKLVREARAVNKIPVLVVRFLAEEVVVVDEREWVMLPLSIFEEIVHVFE